MLTVLQKVFKDKVASPAWQEKLHQVVPSYGTQLNSCPEKVAEEWGYDSVTSDRLGSSPRLKRQRHRRLMLLVVGLCK